MIINDVQFTADLIDILQELIRQLRANDIQLIPKYKEGPTHIQICCPYHNNGMERRPSAGLRKEDGMFHCFACGEVHSLQEVISYCFGHTDDIVGKFGWQWLLKNFATVQVEERKDDGMFHCFACGEVHSLQEVISYCFGHTDDIVGKFGW